MLPSIHKNDRKAEYFFAEGCYILEMSNGKEDPVVSIARARVAPGVTTRWHRLVGIFERYVILEGMGSVEVGELSHAQVGAGAVVHIPPLCSQRITNIGSGDLIFLAVCSPRFIPETYEDLEAD